MKHEILLYVITISVAIIIAYLKFDYTYWMPGIFILIIVIGYYVKKKTREMKQG
jgi:hypothetical protein